MLSVSRRSRPVAAGSDGVGEEDVGYVDDPCFYELIEGLTEKQRAVSVLRYHEGLEIPEIVERRGSTTAT